MGLILRNARQMVNDGFMDLTVTNRRPGDPTTGISFESVLPLPAMQLRTPGILQLYQ